MEEAGFAYAGGAGEKQIVPTALSGLRYILPSAWDSGGPFLGNRSQDCFCANGILSDNFHSSVFFVSYA